VIAPWNRTDVGRASDYAPQQILQSDPNIERGFIDYFGWTEHISAGNPVQWCADSYIGWCTEVLMPAVVHEFNWYVDETDIAVMGSSMGGLASAYALALKPNVFSTALCLSTHWLPGGHALARALTSMLPSPEVGRRVWFDHGTENLDSTYGPFQVTADEVMKDRGYRTPTQWRSSVYDGSDHNEASWNARLPEVLMWWLDKADKP
jgi:enterochelin esterase-like enzyme